MAHVTRDSDTTFKVKRSKVKGQGHQVALLPVARTCEAGAAVTVRTYWVWETTATLRQLGDALGAWAPTEGGEGRGHIVSPRAQLVNSAFYQRLDNLPLNCNSYLIMAPTKKLPLQGQARSQDCQNEETDRSSVPCPPPLSSP